MKRRIAVALAVPLAVTVAVAAVLAVESALGVREGSAGERAPQVAHMVFFQLKDATDAAREKLVAGCREHLTGHEGLVYFSVGNRAEEYDREVNDKTFHVAIHMVFANKAAHDRYQTHERHMKFIEECKDLWSGVRVFDSYLVPGIRAAGPRGPGAEGPALKKAARPAIRAKKATEQPAKEGSGAE